AGFHLLFDLRIHLLQRHREPLQPRLLILPLVVVLAVRHLRACGGVPAGGLFLLHPPLPHQLIGALEALHKRGSAALWVCEPHTQRHHRTQEFLPVHLSSSEVRAFRCTRRRPCSRSSSRDTAASTPRPHRADWCCPARTAAAASASASTASGSVPVPTPPALAATHHWGCCISSAPEPSLLCRCSGSA